MNKPAQIPGKPYTFTRKKTGEKDSGILPAYLGESNDFAMWHKSPKGRGGSWLSRKFVLKRAQERGQGIGPSGLLGRMKILIKNSNVNAKRENGYIPLKTTPEMLVAEWECQKGRCIACDLPLELLEAHYDHDHDSGEGRGFIHPSCNMIEGILGSLPKNNRERLLNWVKEALWWSEVFKGAK
jgi:hypothetical protein